MRISDWSSTCALPIYQVAHRAEPTREHAFGNVVKHADRVGSVERQAAVDDIVAERAEQFDRLREDAADAVVRRGAGAHDRTVGVRSEEHTSELQSLMRISYAVFCLKKKTMTRQNVAQ